MPVRAFVQARMSSARFPGKVLAPLRGEPLILHVVRSAGDAVGAEAVTVLTSTAPSDDPLAAYLEQVGVACYRGPLEDVFERFRLAARQYSCDWIVRLSGDSPRVEASVVRAVVAAAVEGDDVVTTLFPSRTVPKGQAVEVVRADVLAAVPADQLTDDDREHVFPYFYRHADAYSIRCVDPRVEKHDDVAVDTVDDLLRLERGDA